VKNINHVLIQCLGEQISLEEHLCSVIEKQISEIDEESYGDAKAVLVKAKGVLENHFVTLNASMDTLEQDAAEARKLLVDGNGEGSSDPFPKAITRIRISTHLRNNYAALNLITTSNTLLYTTALAFNSPGVAEIALKHLKNLAPIVVQIADLLPDILARELRAELPEIDPQIGQIALKNTKLAWQRID